MVQSIGIIALRSAVYRQNEGPQEGKRRMKRGLCLLLVLLLTGVFSCRAENAEQPALVILDCDMGEMNDDAMALSLLLAAEQAGRVKLLGVTLTGGNAFVDAAFTNDGPEQAGSLECVRKLLEAFGRSELSVYAGRDIPMGYDLDTLPALAESYRVWLRDGEKVPRDYLMDNDTYGALHYFENVTRGTLENRDDAARFLADTALRYPGQVNVIAIGPAGNIARAIELEPRFAASVASIWYMGGNESRTEPGLTASGEETQTLRGANTTPFAEYNVFFDAAAFRSCVTASFPAQYICPGSLCEPVDGKALELLRVRNTGEDTFASLWLEYFERVPPEYPFWDPMTVTAFLKPENITGSETARVTVEADRKSERYGSLTVLTEEEWAGLAEAERSRFGPVTVITGEKGFWELCAELLGKAKLR